MEQRHTLTWNAQERRVEARLERRLGAIVLGKAPDPRPDPAEVAALLIEVVRREGLDALPLGKAARALIERARYAGLKASNRRPCSTRPKTGWPRCSRAIAASIFRRAACTRPCSTASTGMRAASSTGWLRRIPLACGHDPRHRLCPRRRPGGRTARAGAVRARPSPHHRPDPPAAALADLARRAPIQTTADLPAFWRGSWRDVVKDMKGRYPRHRWPDQPWAEDPSLKTRNAFEASRKK
jgi:ATP-dependent helicase HrpB